MIFDHEVLTDIFFDTMSIIESSDELKKISAHSISETEVYEDCTEVRTEKYAKKPGGGRVSVVSGTTFDSARALAEKHGEGHKVAAHNFANAYIHGGGVTVGARAQEECLCRCSTLYKSLEAVYRSGLFYMKHKIQKRENYYEMNQPGIIYTPDVAIIKTDDYKLLDTPVMVDVVTSAAPEMFRKTCPEQELKDIHREKAVALFNLAIEHGADLLVLGAFGCGAFRNPPEVVASVFCDVLNTEVRPGIRYIDCFTEVIFAIRTEREGEAVNYETFRKVMKKLQ